MRVIHEKILYNLTFSRSHTKKFKRKKLILVTFLLLKISKIIILKCSEYKKNIDIFHIPFYHTQSSKSGVYFTLWHWPMQAHPTSGTQQLHVAASYRTGQHGFYCSSNHLDYHCFIYFESSRKCMKSLIHQQSPSQYNFYCVFDPT